MSCRSSSTLGPRTRGDESIPPFQERRSGCLGFGHLRPQWMSGAHVVSDTEKERFRIETSNVTRCLWLPSFPERGVSPGGGGPIDTLLLLGAVGEAQANRSPDGPLCPGASVGGCLHPKPSLPRCGQQETHKGRGLAGVTTGPGLRDLRSLCSETRSQRP